MIGPYTINTKNGKFELRALTMIDPTTGWFKIKDIPDASAESCVKAFDDTWLSRYPRPQYLGYDNGNDYKSVFKEMRQNYGMHKKRSLNIIHNQMEL